MRNSEKPTLRQQEFLAAFRRLVKHNAGISPSLEELAAEMGVKKATAQTFVRRLVAKGVLVRRGTGAYRNLVLAQPKAKREGR